MNENNNTPNNQIVFFGAGQYAANVFNELNEKYLPIAFGDNDYKKKDTYYLGLPIYSLNEIEEKFHNC